MLQTAFSRPIHLAATTRRCYHASVLPSLVSTATPEFRQKAESMDALVSDLKAKIAQAKEGGGPKAQERMRTKGKKLPRERLSLLLDPNTPFLELSQLAALDVYPGENIPGAGIITGIGRVAGKECVVVVNDATVKGGSYYPLTVKKHLRAQEIAREHGLPCIYVVESGGAALPHQANVFPDKDHFGRIFYNMAQMSALGIPQIALVHGISVAGGAYVPAMADENIIVREQGRIFLAGPPLVKAATGEEVNEEVLGGGMMHSSESGVTDHLARDDDHAIAIARDIVGDLGIASGQAVGPSVPPEDPLYPASDLHGIVGTDLRQPFDMRDIIARIVDGSRFREFKKEYGPTIVTGFAHIHGHGVGIVANNGILFSPSALKATHFIQLCSQRKIPLLFLVNVTGYMVGSKAEKGGIAKDGAKMVRAVACADVPKLTVVVGGSFGAGNYGSYSRQIHQNAKVSVMGSGQLSQVMSTSLKAFFRDPNQHSSLKAEIEAQSTALYSTARLWDDGIIQPIETRDIVGLALALAARRRSDVSMPGLGGSPTWDGSGRGFGVFRIDHDVARSRSTVRTVCYELPTSSRQIIMEDVSLLEKLSAETRAKLRSTQLLTSLPTIVSELLQNALDAGASQIDIGVDSAEWSCWVMDDGSGFTKDGLHKVGQGSERGRYNSSKAYNPASLETVSTFGFRGEALASMADLSCLEISSRTARSRESWSVIVKAGRSLYTGPSIRWRRESSGTVVSIRDAFFNVCVRPGLSVQLVTIEQLPVRRQSHPTPNKTIELIRQELEAYALVFPNISFSLQDTSKTREGHNPHKSHILKIPKVTVPPFSVFHFHIALLLSDQDPLHSCGFRHFYGRAFTEEKITATSGQLRIEGFISLVGACTKVERLPFYDRRLHPISSCDLHRLIDNRFAASTFAKHAYDEGGETNLRPSARRSPRKGEKKPVYVLNVVIPVKHIDNCLEPSKSTVELENKNVVTSFLSATIQSFLVHHNFAPEKRRGGNPDDGSPRKKPKLVPECRANLVAPSGSVSLERSGAPSESTHMGKMPMADAQKTVWKDPLTGENFIIDGRTGNSYPQSARFAIDADGSIEASPKRRTLRAPQLTAEENNRSENNTSGNHTPDWLRVALEANDAFALKEPRIPSLPLSVNQAAECRSSQFHNCQTGCPTKHAISARQVDCKFIACVVGLDHDPSGGVRDDGTCGDEILTDGKTLILIDQHAADEREGSGGVETKQLSPPVPVLLTRHEASRLAELSDFQKAFESWGFRFSGLEETRSSLECETDVDGGYIQVLVCTIPEIVSEKLLLGKEMQELVKGHIGALESQELGPREPSSQYESGNLDEETQWLKALRWCPRELLDLINSKACRGAIMFNDPLNIEQCERLVKQLSTTVFPFQCAHGRPSLVPLTRLTPRIGGTKE
ncbi:carboxyl transferase domain-containing protein [Boletus reticuloceps]|uniref:methylcrotonoyl-CoA carboxylase n=1 Tax=Boletus reticuloceps TaxID=495285 RepID=A0A8I2YUH0_9AGAM|nr:carboxyl transferase domain-containing protein [Boletus reticuloceps]